MNRSGVFVAAALLLAAGLASPPAATAQPVCTCDDTGSEICGGQGFLISLVGYNVDQDAGVSTWDYQICSPGPGICNGLVRNGESCLDNDFCRRKGQATDPTATCNRQCGVDDFHDLSHVDVNLPELGTCLNPGQAVSLQQIGGFGNAVLSCGVSHQDPSCDIFGAPGSDFVAKCDVSGGNLDPGECVTMRLTIAGEQPTLGAGATLTVTKAANACVANCLLGPSCEPCVQPPNEECLTRTGGFWGTHPHITNLFLPVTVCGKNLSVVTAGSCNSVTEALCVAPGKEAKGKTAYAQLVRQLAVAKLNLAASAANGGFCGDDIAARIAQCEGLCGASQGVISGSGCIEDLDAFNNSQDTFPTTPPPFDSPGPANPRYCQTANGNGLVIGLGSCS